LRGLARGGGLTLIVEIVAGAEAKTQSDSGRQIAALLSARA
jgi:hypothetical protein